MSFERVYRSTSQNHTHNWSTPAIPQKTEQTKKSLVPKTSEEIENQAFKQNKFDAISLEIKEKRGTITATEAEKLAVLRAKMDLFWEKRMERSLAKQNWYETHRANNNASVAMETSIESVQSKLSIGKPNDFYEQEADKVADEVVQKINSPVNDVHFSEKKIQRQVLPLIEEEEEKSTQTKPEITSLQHQEIPSMEEEEDENEMVIAKSEISSPQRQEISSMEFEEEEEQLATKPEISYLQHQKIDTSQEVAGTTNLETSIERERGLGEPIEKPLQSKLEQGFGADFSQVKIHNDTTSDRLNQAIHAKAFTTGEDIFFKAGEYNPESFEGQKLLAHELTHVVQQTGGRKVRSSFSQKPVEISKKSSVSRQEEDRQPVPKQKISFGSNPILSAIAELVKNIPGYYLLRVILGKDPITQESVPKFAANKIRGIISLIPGGEILYQQLNLTLAIDRGGEWLDKNIAKLNLTWEYISSLLSKAKSSLSPWDLLSPFKAFVKIKKVFLPLTNRIINFAKSAVNKLLEFVLEGALKLAGPQATRVMEVLKGAGELLTNIIKNPKKFINNLVTGLRQGFQNFIGNISTHIKTGLIGWLTGTYAQANISIPENIFSLSGAFNLVTQVLGLTFNYIRSKAVKMFGKKAVSTIEKGSELFQTLKSGGIPALWDLVKDKMNDLKSMVIDQIKDTVVGQVIQAGIKWIISLLNPAGALLKAGMAIYEIITFFVDRAAQVVELVQSVTFAISAIARGALEGAANKVENALVKSLPVAIGFLASLLGISGLAKRVENIIERVRGKIDKAIEKVLIKAKKSVNNLYQQDRSDKKNRSGEKYKNNLSFDIKYNFSMYGQPHQLIGISNKSKFEIIIASNPENLISAIKDAIKELEISNRSAQEKAQYKGMLEQALNKANDVKYDVEMRKGQILSGIKKDPEAEAEAIRQATMAGLAAVARLLKLVAGDAKIKSLDDFYKQAPKERYIPTMKGYKSIGVFIRTELYEKLGEGWPKVRDEVIKDEKPEILDRVRKVQQSKNLQHWEELKEEGVVESNADIKSYDPKKVNYHVDHRRPIVKHWNEKGNNSGDDERYNHMSSRDNLKLVTAQYNTSKGGEGSNYDRFVKLGFTSYIAGGGIENALVIKGKPFLDAAGNELK